MSFPTVLPPQYVLAPTLVSSTPSPNNEQHQAVTALRDKDFASIFPWLQFARLKCSIGQTLQFYDHGGALSNHEARAINALQNCDESDVRLWHQAVSGKSSKTELSILSACKADTFIKNIVQITAIARLPDHRGCRVFQRPKL